MKDQDTSRGNEPLFSLSKPTMTTTRTKKNKETKEKKVSPLYPPTPDSSPCSVEETESITKTEILSTTDKIMNNKALPSPPMTERDTPAAAVCSAEMKPPITTPEVTSSGDDPADKDEPCVNISKESKSDMGSRKQRPINKTVGSVPEAVSPSVPKEKVRRAVASSDSGQQTIKPKPARKKKTQPEQVQKNTITNYYQVRRSGRQTKSEIEKVKQHQLEQQILGHCEDGLEIKYFENKGRGVIATKNFQKGDFVVEYAGDLIDPETAKLREEKYGETPEVGCYMYYFRCASKQYCIDATAESQYLGRLLNHSKAGNCCTRAVMIDKKPYLYLVASRDILTGEELTYDYGDRRKEAIEQHPWLKL
uniref:[histone H4]-lysine(20) N-methyltransferase n=1 Tax=Biomphalaria glabrata TaxID=6526 RepID=A0A2C9JW09_BIOGL